MKVKFKFGIKTYSGTAEEMTYGSFAKDTLCVGREYVYPTITANNTHMGAIMKNLGSVYGNASAEYRSDLAIYATRNGKENFVPHKISPGAYALFVAMMFAWAKTDPLHIDLTAVTIADIITMDAEVRTLERAVEAGYLSHIAVYDDLTNDIQ